MSDSEESKQVEVHEAEQAAPAAEPGGQGASPHDSHAAFHEYSGGQISERTDTTVSPIIWAFWSVVVLACLGIVIGFGLVPGLHPFGKPYDMPEGNTQQGYMEAAASMNSSASYVALASPALIDMNRLPLPAGQSLAQAISDGSDVYQTYCVGCHGPNQDGNGPNSVSLDPKPRNLRNADFMQAMSYQRIWTSVHKGVPGTAMSRWENVISDDQIQDVICYVLSLTAPTDPKTGQFVQPSAQDVAGASPDQARPGS
jgi:mono/diheme cytochrome c family protein